MDGFVDVDQLRAELDGPFPSGRMNPVELGDTLAQLVWESFSDFVADAEYQPFLARLGVSTEDGLPRERIAEELLIFHMWAHSRATQLAFQGAETSGEATRALDRMHLAVFEDMVENGTPQPQIPVFEQRVSARYAGYYAAARTSDQKVGETALGYLQEGGAELDETAPRLLTERAIEIANPLRDFLSDVELVSD